MNKNLIKIFIHLHLCIGCIGFVHAEERIALIIGNSKYQELGILNNSINDARAIEKSLKNIGYKTTTILDGSESNIRKGIKKFAIDSEQAQVAVVYYAGHGAQINGENYLLPIDLEAPKRESDIQLSSIKIDDIVNSLKSKIKVIFLDACRDNPVIAKNLAKGRGSYRGGLAPTLNNYSEANTGGIFIAYATDSGNIALDGEGQKNSPFAESLVKYISEPISIDDMFSKVTKEVRAKTNNNQKPYKYASLEDIFCMTIVCGISIDKQIKSLNSSNIKNVEWVLFNIGNESLNQAWYINPSTIVNDEDRTYADIKIFTMEDDNNKKENSYDINSMTFECKTGKGNIYKGVSFDNKNNKIIDNAYGLPKTVKLDYDYNIKGSLGLSILELICNKPKYEHLTNVKIDQSPEWERFFTLNGGDEIYIKKNSIKKTGSYFEVKTAVVFNKPQTLSRSNLYQAYRKLKNSPIIEFSAAIQRIDCIEKKYWSYVEQIYDQNSELVLYALYQEHLSSKLDITAGSAFDQLHKSVCKL